MNNSIDTLIEGCHDYLSARLKFLALMGCEESKRDPLEEFSERLVACWLNAQHIGGTNPGYDLVGLKGEKIEVKYVLNKLDEHTVDANPDPKKPKKAIWDIYAIVLMRNTRPELIVVFPKSSLSSIYEELGKSHQNKGTELQLGKADFETIRSKEEQFFRKCDVRVLRGDQLTT